MKLKVRERVTVCGFFGRIAGNTPGLVGTGIGQRNALFNVIGAG